MTPFTQVVAVAGIILAYYCYRQREIIPLPTPKLNGTYDYIIVGAGAAGSVLARRLSEESDVSILILEAGDVENNPTYDIPWNAPHAQMTKADWMYYTEPQEYGCLGMNEQRQFIPRGKGLGGSTLVNGLVYIRGSRYDYDTWASEGCDDWSYDEVLPYFKKIEDVRIDTLANSEYRSTGGPQIITDTTHSEVAHAWLKAGTEMGYDIKDCNGDNGWQRGFCRMQAIVGKSIRWHAARGYLWPAMSRDNLHVSVRSHVTKVLFKSEKAVGVETIKDGRKRKFMARKEVILSAGAIGTPQILLLSGIGPRKQLEELQIPVIKDLPVGEGVQDHVQFFVKFNTQKPVTITTEKVNSWHTWLRYHLFGTGYLATNAATESTAFICTDPEKQSPSYNCPDVQYIFVSTLAEHGESFDHFNFNPEINKEIYGSIHDVSKMPDGFSVVIETTHPRSKGTIKLRSTDPFDYPKIDIRYFEDPYDVKPILRGLRWLQKLLETKSMREIGATMRTKRISACSGHSDDSDAFWDCMIRHLSVSGYHVSASCKMGPKSYPGTVVDNQLRVHGINGLRIVDASVFPNVTSGNTMAPTMMIAEKAADIIRGIHSVEKFKINKS